MFKKWSKGGFDAQGGRKKTLVLTVFLVAAVFCLVIFVSFAGIRLKNQAGNDRKELVQYWEAGSYDEVFELSQAGLEKKPLDFFYLSLYGFSSYQLAIAQINTSATLAYIDGCVWSLRKALLTREGEKDQRVRYVLGKAYYYKGPFYADLAILYLEEAREAGFQAPDMDEYLGLSYAAVEDYRSSVEFLTMKLEAEPGEDEDARISDLRLLAIARSYIGLGESGSAKAYLIRCVETSRDADTVVQAQLLLGKILLEESDFSGAEEQFSAVLENGEDNAEAHFFLGELFSAAGDPTRARAEWRRALRIDPAHGQARARLNQ